MIYLKLAAPAPINMKVYSFTGGHVLQSEPITGASSTLVLPLNEALQKSDNAQFALMLSLLSEARTQLPGKAFAEDESNSKQTFYSPQPSYNMNLSLSHSLQSNSLTHFNLINSLYHERPVQLPEPEPVPGSYVSNHQGGAVISEKIDTVLTDINQGRRSLVA